MVARKQQRKLRLSHYGLECCGMLIPVILCGGAGSRLWPASREGFPKPFMRLPDGDSLIAKTIRRARAVAPDAPIIFVSGTGHGFLIQQAMADIGDCGPAQYLLEPVARNTAPAVAAAALWAQETYGDDVRLLVLSADHLITDVASFAKSVHAADAAAQTGALVTFGITPTEPETGYGYLQQGEEIADQTFKVARFVEKPPLVEAERYVAAGTYTWNSGMFCFPIAELLAAMHAFAPEVLSATKATLAASKVRGNEITLDKAAFEQCPSISVDYAVMEHAMNVAMVRARFDWSDVGAWPALAQIVPPDSNGNRAVGHHLVDCENVFIDSVRTVAAIGLKDTIIVDGGDAILVTHASRAQDVKKITESLKKSNPELTKLHLKVRRPWGSYTILEDRDDCKVKRLTVNPGASISLQLHHKRSEHWVVVDGEATITNGKNVLTLNSGESTFIPVGTKHRLENKTSSPVSIIETQVGTYFGEDDIIRFDDQYGRS
jgi:mannose-1-phosphate guanylyltransferase / mannose-6-phosphate isomerase